MPVVSTYQQAIEPTDLTPGTTWLRDDGTAAVRKLDLTWNEIGNWELPNFGNVSIRGGTMLGPLLGAHGLAPLVDTPLTGVPTSNGIDLADQQWVKDQLTAMLTTINNLISNAIGGTNGNITIGSNLAVGYGTVADGGTIPLPVFSDNTRADKSQVWGVLVSMNNAAYSTGSEATSWANKCTVDVNLVVTCGVSITSGGGGSNHGSTDGASTANYIVICKR
jgi:hypothetical protein